MNQDEIKCPKCKGQELEGVDTYGQDLDGSFTAAYRCIDCGCLFEAYGYIEYCETIKIISDKEVSK